MKFYENPCSGSGVVPCGRTDRKTHMTKLIGAFRHFANAPKNVALFLLTKPTDALISQIYFVKKLYMFRAAPLPIIRNFSLYIRQWGKRA